MTQLDLENMGRAMLEDPILKHDRFCTKNRLLHQVSSSSLKPGFALLDSATLQSPRIDFGSRLLQSSIDTAPKLSFQSVAELGKDKEIRDSSLRVLSSPLVNALQITIEARKLETTSKVLNFELPKVDSLELKFLKSTNLKCENTLLSSGPLVFHEEKILHTSSVVRQEGNLLDAATIHILDEQNAKTESTPGPVENGDTADEQGSESDIVFRDDFQDFVLNGDRAAAEINDSSLSLDGALAYRRDLKTDFVNAVSGALIASPNFSNKDDQTRQFIFEKASAVAELEPEFILKVAVYARRELNLRTPANFLLAVSALITDCRQYLKQYFGTAVQLPTDWIEAAELYRSLVVPDDDSRSIAKVSLPAALRRAMTEKFLDFDIYQLAKYNKRKKTNKKSEKEKLQMAKCRRGRWRTKEDDVERSEDQTADKSSGKLNLKRLVRALHVRKPAFNVMAIVGKKYPSDPVTFGRCGLLGVFDESKAGKRIKLPIPETWEASLAREGNKPEVWQRLLEKRKLPFMAMLRNLKNMIRVGIGPEYHSMVLKRLQDETAVTQSKQFPFRFFSAYQALDDLEEEYQKKVNDITAARDVGLKLGAANRKKRQVQWWTQKRQARKMRQDIHYDHTLLNRYRKALDTAVKIATTHNVSPISGRMVVFCKADATMASLCTGSKGLGKPKTTLEVGALLALLCKHVCEDCVFMIFTDGGIREIALSKGTILNNVEVVLSQATSLREEEVTVNDKEALAALADMLRQYSVERTKINSLLLVTNSPRGSPDDVIFVNELKRYRDLVYSDALYVNVNLSPVQAGMETGETHPRNVYLRGYSDQILRYIAIRGGDSHLLRIDRIDEVYKLKKAKEVDRRRSSRICGFDFLGAREPERSKLIKIFVSSTFRDMHGERTVLLRYVFPELQRRAARFGLTVLPIDLRWGISEADAHSMRSLELCLREVSKCQLFIALLAERHGWRPSTYGIGDASEDFAWLLNHAPGASITELEIEQFALQDIEKARGRCFFYFRNKLSKVPEAYRKDMCEESEEAAKRMLRLKRRIRGAGHTAMENYPCQWSGVHEGFPSVSKLEVLAQRTLDDLWRAICELHGNEGERVDESNAFDTLSMQWSFIDGVNKKFVGRDNVLESILATLQKLQAGIIALEAPASYGSTSLVAKVASISKNHQQKCGTPIVFFSDALRGQLESKHALHYLYDYLRVLNEGKPQRLPANASITSEMWTECISNLVGQGYRLLFVLDGLLDHQIEWLVEATGNKATFLITGPSNTSLLSMLEKQKVKVVRIPVGGLDRSDSAAIARNTLASYGKRFEESAFNSQMRLLLSKRDSNKPSYLLSVCEYLRLYAASENITPLLLRLPSTMESLARMVITRAESEHGAVLVTAMLAFIAYNQGELSTSDLYHVCALATDTGTPGGRTVTAYRRLPYSTFLFGLNALRTILREQLLRGHTTWAFLDDNISTLIKVRCSKSGFDQKRCLKLLAEHLLATCDPNGDKRFVRLDRYNCLALPKTLVALGEWERLCHILSSIDVVKKCFELGSASSLIAYRGVVAKNVENSKLLTDQDRRLFFDLSKFLSRNCDFLLRRVYDSLEYPRLVDQQMLNEPKVSLISPLVSSTLDEERGRNYAVVRWDSRQDHHSFCDRTVDFGGGVVVRAVAISPKRRLLAVAVGCVVKVSDYESGQEIHGFVGHQDVVNDICFVTDTVFCSCGDDGLAVVWDTDAKVKLATLEGHLGHVSACIPYSNSKAFNVITVGWDSSIRLWNYLTSKAYEIVSTKPASPINCVDCHPEDALVVTGHWCGALMLHRVDPASRKAVLRGHKSSVRAVAYYKSGLFIVSASFDGEVRLWSAEYGTMVGSFIGHLAPVNRIVLTKDYLVSASDDSAVKLWSPMLGQMQGTVSPKQENCDFGSASACALSPDGHFLAVGYSNSAVVLHDLKVVDSVKWTSQMDSSIQRIRFVPLSKNLLVACRSSVQIIDFGADAVVLTFETGHGNVECADCGTTVLVVGHASGAICFCSLLTAGSQRSAAPSAVVFSLQGSVTDCTLSPDGTFVATASTDKTLSIWKVSDVLAGKTKLPVKSFSQCHNEWITSCSWSNTKNVIATASSDCTTKLWDVGGSETPLVTLKGHSAPVVCVRMKRGCVATASLDGTVAVWSHKGVLVTQLKPNAKHHELPTSLDFLLDLSDFGSYDDNRSWAEIVEEEPHEASKPDSALGGEESFNVASMKDSIIAVCYSNGQCRIWKPFLGDERVSLMSHTSSVLGLSATVTATDLRLASGGADGRCNTWSIDTFDNLENREAAPVHRGMVTYICARPAGDLLCTGGLDGNCALIYSEATNHGFGSPYIWKAHKNSVSCALWTNNERLFTGGEDGLIKLWSLQDCEDGPIRCASRLSLGQPVVSVACCNLDDKALIVALWSGAIVQIGWEAESELLAVVGTVAMSTGTIRSVRCIDRLIQAAVADQSATFSTQSGFWKTVAYPTTACFGEFHSLLLRGTDGGEVIAVSSGSGEEQWRINAHTSAVTGIIALPSNEPSDYAFFITASKDCFVRLWRATDAVKLIGLWRAPAPLTCLEGGDDKRGKLWCGDALGRVHELTVLWC